MTFEPAVASCRVLPRGRPAESAAQLHERVLATLGLTIDPLRFETQVIGDPELAGLIAGQRGLRVPLIADPFDGLVWAIVGQQINLAFAYQLRRRLIELVSQLDTGRVVHATCSGGCRGVGTGRSGGAEVFTRQGRVPDRRGALGGRWPPAVGGARRRFGHAIERTLRAVRGIGPWSAHS